MEHDGNEGLLKRALGPLHHLTMVACAAALLAVALPHGAAAALAWALGGWCLLSLVAYLLHRFGMHGGGAVARAHARHHANPTVEQLDALSWFGPIGIIFSAWPLAWLLGAGVPASCALVAGGCLAYSWFREVHRWVHAASPPRWMMPLVRFHRLHHADPRVNFGITVAFWDWLFETGQRQASHQAAASTLERHALGWVRDPRDLAFVRLSLTAALLMAVWAVLLFLVPAWLCAVLALPYLAVLYLRFGGPLLLLVHAVTHRRAFTAQGRWLERWILLGIPVLYGIAPQAYPAHHVAMHHVEGNGEPDASCTLCYVRDSAAEFLRYYFRFLCFGLLHTGHYLAARRRWRVLRRMAATEIAFMGAVGVALVLAPVPATVVLLLPWLLSRFFLMAGNWAQHAFVNLDTPHDRLGNATVLLNSRHNERCFNDGYHAVHHRHPAMHWTEMPAAFEGDRDTYAAHGSVVFDGIANNQVVWWNLMRGNWGFLADHLAPLPGVPAGRAARMAWLRDRARLRVVPPKGLLELREGAELAP